MNKREELLLFELEQAREDQRASFGHIIQIAVAGVAGLALIFTLAQRSSGGSSSSFPGERGSFLALLSLGIVFATFYLVSSLGSERSFRYHYMRELEEKIREDSCLLAKLRSEEMVVMGWNELSSPFITMNPHHVETASAKVHFSHELIGILAALCVCVLFVVFFAVSSANAFVWTAVAVLGAVLVSYLIAGYMRVTSKSRNMYEENKVVAERRREESGNVKIDGRLAPSLTSPSSTNASYSRQSRFSGLLKVLLYQIYPRPRDVLKIGFIILGVALGFCLCPEEMASMEVVLRGVLAVLLMDVLSYQARYQINDIRGILEDDGNPRAQFRGRMPLWGGSLKKTVICSLVTASLKIVLAVGLSIAAGWFFHDHGLAVGSILCMGLVFVLGSGYEAVRAKGTEMWRALRCEEPRLELLDRSVLDPALMGKLRRAAAPACILVSLGYPLRVVSGLTILWPSWFCDLFAAPSAFAFPVALLLALVLFASAAFGESFVTLTWALEASDLKRQIDFIEAPTENTLAGARVFYKPHIVVLGYELGGAVEEEYPLRWDGGLGAQVKLWNLSMLASLVLLGIAAFLIAARFPLVVDEACPLGATALLCSALFIVANLRPSYMSVWMGLSVLICSGWVLFLLIPWCLTGVFAEIDLAVVLGFTIALYTLIYLAFRSTNYKEMNKSIAQSILSGILGDEVAKKVFGW